uniref:Cytochrome b-c1 complex subunit 7 n=1 Tax=Coccolithus braarudii TaxID=221442 RepID=A0A7S0PWC0_9EUKA|mmetsp:Transcript_15855/g.34435  ORF Transcript_15855/g.34435 Transcript_15855/m.34435 type:complete len:110 (+) Transcript_15855:58-387(+)
MGQAAMAPVKAVYRVNRRFEAKMLSKYGLKRDDVLREHPDVVEALRLLPPAVQVARHRRIMRAIDLDLKREYLPEKLRPTEKEIYEPYLQPYITKVQEAKAEKARYAHR